LNRKGYMSEGIYFTSDEHFGHANIVRFCDRPFSSLEEMRETIIENHNKVVKAGDRVYHIGDMYWRTVTDAEALQIRHRLNGQHYYIFGNHDEVFHRSREIRESFIWCKERFNLKVTGYPNIVLDHFPGRVWNGSHNGAWQLYGHCHGNLPEDGSLSFDIGVDSQNFLPISLEQVAAKMKTIGEKFMGKVFTCPKEECGRKFVPHHTRQTFCAKCGTEMELK
jgi:calcineurin-like phosphoesterase family protein